MRVTTSVQMFLYKVSGEGDGKAGERGPWSVVEGSELGKVSGFMQQQHM